jgi:hypothetical protein
LQLHPKVLDIFASIPIRGIDSQHVAESRSWRPRRFFLRRKTNAVSGQPRNCGRAPQEQDQILREASSPRRH